jgi:1-deoxy-D-xylulose-5-phosphate synthase
MMCVFPICRWYLRWIAGVVGEDGPTHHGQFDVSYLRSLPNMTLMAPKDENELRHMFFTAFHHNGPVAIRYPRGSGLGVPLDDEFRQLPMGEMEILKKEKIFRCWHWGAWFIRP